MFRTVEKQKFMLNKARGEKILNVLKPSKSE